PRQCVTLLEVSAGDSLETMRSGHGASAAARSIRDSATIMNVDVGGGTSKIAICVDGRVVDLTALDVGARLICLDPAGRIVRVEKAARRFGAELGIALELGAQLAPDAAHILAARMADCLFAAMDGGSPMAGGGKILRLSAFVPSGPVGPFIFFCGGCLTNDWDTEANCGRVSRHAFSAD